MASNYAKNYRVDSFFSGFQQVILVQIFENFKMLSVIKNKWSNAKIKNKYFLVIFKKNFLVYYRDCIGKTDFWT